MKIDSNMATYEIAKQLPNTTAGVADGKQPSREAKPEGAVNQSGAAVVHISQASKEVQLADKIIATAPDTRDAKVAEIKMKIESGNYKIDHEKIAAKLIDQDLEEMF
jgi:flagellar biosynthesis anti-sigma factor FlgM